MSDTPVDSMDELEVEEVVTPADTYQDKAVLSVSGLRLNEEVILDLIADLTLPPDVVRASDISILVAQTIRQLGIQPGGRLIFPVTNLIARTAHVSTDPHDDGTLVYKISRLERAAKYEVMKAGLELGDRSVQFAAGLSFPGIQRSMGPDELSMYATNMAHLGYKRACIAAEKYNWIQFGKSIAQTIPYIRSQLAAVIKIISSLVMKKPDLTKKLALVQ